jgi:hypothetical protein
MDKSNINKIDWVAPEYPFWKKSREWYIAVSIIGGSLVIAAVIFNNFILAVLITIIIFSLLIMATVPPKKISVSIDNKGVIIGSYLYSFINLESFWISNLENPSRLYLKSKKVFSPMIMIEIMDTEEEMIRNFLKKYLKEEELYESLLHRVMERLGF